MGPFDTFFYITVFFEEEELNWYHMPHKTE